MRKKRQHLILFIVFCIGLTYTGYCQAAKLKDSVSGKTTIITVNMRGLDFSRMPIHFYNDFLETKKYPIKEYKYDSSNGNVICKILLDSPMLLKYFMKDVFVTPGDSIHLDYKVFSATPDYHDTLLISGKHQGNYLYFKIFGNDSYSWRNLPTYQNPLERNSFSKFKMDFESYFKHIRSEANKSLKKNTTSGYKRFLKKELKRVKLFYFWLTVFQNDTNRLTDKARKLYKNEMLKYVDLNSTYFKEGILFLHHQFLLKRGLRYDITEFDKLVADASTFPENIKEYLLTADIINYAQNANSQNDELKTRIKKTAAAIITKEYIEKLTAYNVYKGELDVPFLTEELKKIKLQDRSGQIILLDSLLSCFKGKLEYLDFWASWCAPCRAEIPALKKLISIYKDSSIKFIQISIDENKDKWKEAIKEEGTENSLQYCLVNPRDYKVLENQFNFYGVPRYFLLDTKGDLILKSAPYPRTLIETQELEKYLKPG